MTQQLMLREPAAQALTLPNLLQCRSALVAVAASTAGLSLAEVAPRVVEVRRQKAEKAAAASRLAAQRRSNKPVFRFD